MRVEHGDTIYDDSRNWKQPVELILGKKFKLEVLESALRTMGSREVAKFIIDKSVRPYLPKR